MSGPREDSSEESSAAPWTRVLPDEEPEELTASSRSPLDGRSTRLFPWAVLATLTFIALALLWSACETHYRACIEAVDVRAGEETSPLARLAREEEADKCTRAPF